MLKLFRPQPWTCARCLLRQQRAQARRGVATTATATAANSHLDQALADYSAPDRRQDDQTLRKIFDSQPVWREFSQKRAGLDGRNVGLVQNQYLTSPDGFEEFAHDTLQKCKEIVSKTLAASSLEEYRAMARDLDRLSDLLCRVIDVSDFMRATHPDPRFVDAATQAYSLVFEYMNVLNTTAGLNEQLKKASSMPEVISHWSEEEKVVAEILMKDFAKSAIDLPPAQRQRFVNLSNDISQIGTDFVNEMEPATPHITVQARKLNGMDPSVVQKLTRWNKSMIPIFSQASTLALSSVHDEATRKQVYMAYRTASKKQVHRLEALLQKRAELAELSGYPSFAHMTLTDKMAKTPEAVTNFLESLNASNKSQAATEISHLLSLKHGIDPSSTRLDAWDYAYYLNRAKQTSKISPRTSRSRHLDLLPSFFSIGTVMQGLSRLFTRLYGVRLVPKPTSPGETWNPDVRRLDVFGEDSGHIAVIYCDLFTRAGKSPNPAHFTLRCSREISPREIAESASLGRHPNDGMATGVGSSSAAPHTRTLHQLPTIALICDFPDPSPSTPALLNLHHITTLFHEMGHAVHSILGRTSLQSISGTRCASDFSELPSILMEYFAFSPAVLRLFARHWDSDALITDELITAIGLEKQERARLSGALDDETQILMALLDQKLHAPTQSRQALDSTRLFHEVWNTHGSLQEPPGTAWQGFFGHLYGYGATYYSYLFDRAIARQVWRTIFKDGEGVEGRGSGALDRDAGEKFRAEVLKWGGGKDPWMCLEGLLQDDRLGQGGERAMKEVGRWGVGLAGQ